MRNRRIALAAGALLAAGAAHAGSYSLTSTIATDYDFRGISQTDPLDQDGKVAFQLGGSYSFDGGIYFGMWGSNVDDSYTTPSLYFRDGHNLQVDYYGGYGWGKDARNAFAYDAGLDIRTYSGWSAFDTVEGYVAVSRSFYSAKLSFTPNVAHTGTSSLYAELNASYPLGKAGVSLLGHVGQTLGGAYDAPYITSQHDRTDYSLGAGYVFHHLNFAVKYVDGTKDIHGRVIGSVSTTLPWSGD